VKNEYGLDLLNTISNLKYEAAIIAVSHSDFKNLNIRSFLVPNGVVFDVKGIFPKNYVDARL